MTCVCVGCGTEVKDKEGRPVEKLYDQVNTCSGRNVNDIYHLKVNEIFTLSPFS